LTSGGHTWKPIAAALSAFDRPSTLRIGGGATSRIVGSAFSKASGAVSCGGFLCTGGCSCGTT
jgi:hypothetical protein